MNKRLLSIIIFLGFALGANSQITLGQADMPKAGDTLRVSYCNDTLNPLLTGSNYTWGYEYFKPNAQWIQKFDPPRSFPSPLNLIFMSASFGLEQYTPDSIPVVGIKPQHAYSFYKLSTANYKQIGSGLTINGLPIPILYNNHDTIYHFPIQYGKRDSSNSKFGLQIPNVGYYGQEIHRVNYVDGWGTLKTPFGIFQTIRVKSQLTIIDTIADTSGIGFSFKRPLQYEFKWLKQDGKIPYLEVIANEIAGKLVISRISYRDIKRDSVIQVHTDELMNDVADIKVFPNPANIFCVVEYTVEKNVDVVIDLIDLSGNTVMNIRNSSQSPGRYIEAINLSDNKISAGVYFIRLYIGGIIGSRKIIITTP